MSIFIRIYPFPITIRLIYIKLKAPESFLSYCANLYSFAMLIKELYSIHAKYLVKILKNGQHKFLFDKMPRQILLLLIL